ncbi:MAG: 50S ribosomal protein L4 [Candidatus Komeilibacteria bacterium RIFCSPLOWO2_02_FULL_48_11]|uniref:Large ribosomal subunit protein uL4 n=1 Tax=Candidatus Komeilibacteria bacterium RIFCSPLOWO2_02_FULL_48_11 TaxID=1798553 RepID=A0A1G2BT55_9BACT|nr:MAG: 50S ribosomal protein L4 [Candidatus Komeilibacteria bacterium RIFCSPLOWO2_02_FULL_48_11]
MPQVKIYNLEGAEVGVLDLDEKVFSETAKPELIYQVVRVMQARARQVLAHTKDRSQVRGGGKKPWKQKGTGRARHGSIRSPIWRGGGVTFGPTKERNFKLTIPRKMVKKALRALLAEKAADNRLIVCDSLSLEKPSTKKMIFFFSQLGLSSKKVLFLSDKGLENAILSVGNLRKITALRLENLNVLDLLSHHSVLLARSSVEKLTKQLS